MRKEGRRRDGGGEAETEGKNMTKSRNITGAHRSYRAHIKIFFLFTSTVDCDKSYLTVAISTVTHFEWRSVRFQLDKFRFDTKAAKRRHKPKFFYIVRRKLLG